MLGFQKQNGVRMWPVGSGSSCHLTYPPFIHKGCRESCMEGGSERSWFWGALVQQCQGQCPAARTNCPFMELFKESLSGGLGWPKESEWGGERGLCLQTGVHSAKL